MSTNREPEIIFHTGDIVKYINKKRKTWKLNQLHIINEVHYEGYGTFTYSTNRGAWFQAEDFTLVQRATKESFKQLDKDLKLESEHNLELE